MEAENEGAAPERVTTPGIGHTLFGADVSYGRLAGMLSQGAIVRSTKLTEAFDFHTYYRKYFRRAVPLFALDPRGRLRIFTADKDLTPGAGWTMLALVAPEPEAEPESNDTAKPGGGAGEEPDTSSATNKG